MKSRRADPLYRRSLASGKHLIFDRNDFIEKSLIQKAGIKPAPDSLDFVRPRLAAGKDR